MSQVPDPAVPLALLRTVLAGRLARWTRHAVDGPGIRRAAVAITMFEQAGSPHFLMIKRVTRGSNPGQWALPGGRLNDAEGPIHAALRELHEETGLVAAESDVLGMLDDFPATRGIVITPVVVALAGPQHPRRNPTEVASVHPLPLARLTAPGVPRWRNSGGDSLLQLPLRHDMVVHAPTGAILWQFAEVALRGRAVRVKGLAEPGFTAR